MIYQTNLFLQIMNNIIYPPSLQIEGRESTNILTSQYYYLTCASGRVLWRNNKRADLRYFDALSSYYFFYLSSIYISHMFGNCDATTRFFLFFFRLLVMFCASCGIGTITPGNEPTKSLNR